MIMLSMKKIIKYFCNFGGRFISYFSGNIKKITFDKVKYEKKIDVLGQEITRLNVLLFAIKEIINQSEECFEVYKQYNEFFYLTYELYHLMVMLKHGPPIYNQDYPTRNH